MDQDRFNILLGQRLEPVERYLRESGVNYRIEIAEPTRCLGQVGSYRIISVKSLGPGCIQLTCARESI